MRKFCTKTLQLETPTRPPLWYTLRMITMQAVVAGEVRCSWSQAGIVGLCFPAKNNKCIVERIVSWTMHRETYHIVSPPHKRYIPETLLQFKTQEIAFAYNLFLSRQIILKFFTENNSIIAVFRAKVQNNLKSGMDTMNGWVWPGKKHRPDSCGN